MLEEVKRVSSVSGASLCVGLIYAHNDLTWPSSKTFLSAVLPSIERAILANDIQTSAVLRLIHSPYYWNKKPNVIAKQLEYQWGIYGSLADLSGGVTWYTNCTTYETGKRFRFCKENMGDYKIGYVEHPDIPLSHVMAASAGFPILIGPYCLRTSGYQWNRSKFSNADYSPQAAKALMKSPNLLQDIYEEWIGREDSHMDELRQTVADFKSYMVKTEKILSGKER